MSPQARHDLPDRLKRTRERFERWRRTRRGRARIPEPLWASAVKAAGRYGLHPTARALGLDYNALKKRTQTATRRPGPERGGAAGFVEWVPAPLGGSPECILELEHPGGAKMRVHLKGMSAPDLAALSRSFWGLDA